MEYKTDYRYANIRLLICHGSANITRNAGLNCKRVSGSLAKHFKTTRLSYRIDLGNFEFPKEQVLRIDIISEFLFRNCCASKPLNCFQSVGSCVLNSLIQELLSINANMIEMLLFTSVGGCSGIFVLFDSPTSGKFEIFPFPCFSVSSK